MQQCLDEFMIFANLLADTARQISRQYFRQNLIIESKENNTPVTIADKKIELALRKLIKEHYPKHGIIGEEFTDEATCGDYCWVIDPIDGTLAFSCGKPTFTTLIALMYQKKPLLGIVDQAISEERFYALSGKTAYLNQLQLQTSGLNNLCLAHLNATSPDIFKSNYEQEKFELVRKQVRLNSFGGDAYAFCLLAAGHLELVMEASLEYYDVAALIPIIIASGGVISDWQGKELEPNFNGQCLASANLSLHQAVLALINN